MNDDKQYTEGISVNKSKALLWFENYWYHYKWATIVAAFLIVVFAVCTIQACSNTKKDIAITYAGRSYLSLEQNADIEKVLSGALPEEKSQVELLSYYVLSKEQIEKLQGTKDENGDPIHIDTVFIDQEFDTFVSQLQTGTGSILLIDRWVYDSFFSEDGTTERLMPLSETLGVKPECAIDEYGILLKDTELYQNNAAIRLLPGDTVVCLHRKLLAQKNYEKEIEGFQSIAKVAAKTSNEES